MPHVAQKWYSGDFSDGCTRNSMSCGDTFLKLKMMMIGEKPEQKTLVKNGTECEKLCLQNCGCKSYSYSQRIWMPCWIWTQEFVNLQEEYDYGYNLSIRVAISDIGTALTGRSYINLLEFTTWYIVLHEI